MKYWARVCLAAALLAAGQFAFAQAKLTVDQLVSFIKSSIQLKHDDRKVADYVKKIRLTNKLDARTVEELQGDGAGPATVQALKGLMTETASLEVAPPPPPKPIVVGPPPPDSIEQQQILDQIKENAMNYTRNLPNFLCLQVTRRYMDPSGMENYRQMDTIAERLSYFEQHEKYDVVSVNGIPSTGRSHEQLGGATSSGEFGSILAEIFNPETDTKFDWERWATLRGKRMYVFAYRVPQSTSKYSIYADSVKRTIIAGYHGLVYADRDTKMVMRIVLEAENLPVDFPIQSVNLDLNYDYATISGQQFLLPLKSQIHSREGKYLVKNETEFRMYNRYTTESSITFGDDVAVPDALPEDKTKEEPPAK